MKRFSKLKKRIESLFSPEINLRVYCTVNPINNSFWGYCNPQYKIVLNKEVIFDFINDFRGLRKPVEEGNYWAKEGGEPIWYEDVSLISALIREYIDTPADKLFDHVFENDYFGLTDILKAADRRIGKKRLLLLKDRTTSQAAEKIVAARLGKNLS